LDVWRRIVLGHIHVFDHRRLTVNLCPDPNVGKGTCGIIIGSILSNGGLRNVGRKFHSRRRRWSASTNSLMADAGEAGLRPTIAGSSDRSLVSDKIFPEIPSFSAKFGDDGLNDAV